MKNCGKSELDMHYHCPGKELELVEGQNYKGGIIIEEASFMKWLKDRGLNEKYYIENLLNVSASYLDKLRDEFQNDEDFLLSPFVFEELLDIAPLLKQVDIDDIEHKQVKIQAKLDLNCLKTIFDKYVNLQSTLSDITPEDRTNFSSIGLYGNSISFMQKHNILTESSYTNGTIDKGMVNLIKSLNNNGLETAYCCQGHRRPLAYVRFHSSVDASRIASHWAHMCYRAMADGIRLKLITRLESVFTYEKGNYLQSVILIYKDSNLLREGLSKVYKEDLTSADWDTVTLKMADYLSSLSSNKVFKLASVNKGL